MESLPTQTHGRMRGVENVPHLTQFDGRFRRMFPSLPSAQFREDDLKELGKIGNMTAMSDATPIPEGQDDSEENTGISAGYTYLGQFIDHDLTFDPNSSRDKQNACDALVNFVTPRFDLHSVYGRGPDDESYLYDADRVRMLLGRQLTGNPHAKNTKDVQRDALGRALIGDSRNDENVIISQLQSTFLRFHNRVANVLKASDPADFPTIQRLVRWHYQWVVLTDFLPTIIGHQTFDAILPHVAKKTSISQNPPDLRYYNWNEGPFLPIEFSFAAYRFGHSMMRPIYRLNRNVPRLTTFPADLNTDLRGFREFPANWAIEWNLFFHMEPKPSPVDKKTRVQPAHKIDTSLVNPFVNLPTEVASHLPTLAERNLIRGLRMGVPSGQLVAHAMGMLVIPDDRLQVGKATEEDTVKNPRLVDISPRFRNNSPLWYYILAEAQQAFRNDKTPIHLGPVGGRIVGEVFVGLLLGDRHSFLVQDPDWQPMREFVKDDKFGIAELIAQSIQA